MNISDITGGVVELFTFIRKRFLACLFVLGIPWFVSSRLVHDLLGRISLPGEHAQIQKALSTYGLQKLLPIIAFFVVLLFAQIADEIVILFADILPGSVQINPVVIMSVVLGGGPRGPSYDPHFPQMASQIIDRFPEASDEVRCWSAIVEFLETLDATHSPARREVDHRKEALNSKAELFGAAKFCLFWALIWGVTEIVIYDSGSKIVAIRLSLVAALSIATMIVAGYLTIEKFVDVVISSLEAALIRPVADEKRIRPSIIFEMDHPPPFWRFVWFSEGWFTLSRVRFFLGWHSKRVPCFHIERAERTSSAEVLPTSEDP